MKEIEARGRRGAAFAQDVTGEEAVANLIDAVEDSSEHLDVLVHTV